MLTLDIVLSLTVPSVSTTGVVLLILISLVGGIGITAIGPGGVLVTIGLFALTDLSPAEVAGTAIVTHIGTGIVGSLAYLRSGQLRQQFTRKLAIVLSLAAIIGTPIGVWVNAQVSTQQFGVMLAVLIVVIGLSILTRELRMRRTTIPPVETPGNVASQAAIGGGVAIVSGMFGVGGPMISVPVMVVAGFPLLSALAAAQAQSIVVAGAGTITYLAQDAVSWPLVALTGIPEMIGVWLGWRVAHTVPTRPLRYVLAITLIVLGPVLVMNG